MPRFDWTRESRVNCCFELQRRNICRRTQKDMNIPCCACGTKPTKGQDVYQPLEGYDPKRPGIVIGHKECVDKEVAKHTAASVGQAKAAAHAQEVLDRKILIESNSPAEVISLSTTELLTRLSQFKSSVESKQETAEEAYERGRRAGLAEALMLLQGHQANQVQR